MPRGQHTPPWDIEVHGMDTQSIAQAGVLAILRPFFPKEHMGKLMERVGQDKFMEILKMMELGLEDAKSVGVIHQRQNWLSPVSKYVQDKGSCWQCRFCYQVVFSNEPVVHPDAIKHHPACFLMTGLSGQERGHSRQVLNMVPIPDMQICGNSRAEVTPSKNVKAMVCWECNFVVDVLPYEHPKHGSCHMLAEHYHYDWTPSE